MLLSTSSRFSMIFTRDSSTPQSLRRYTQLGSMLFTICSFVVFVTSCHCHEDSSWNESPVYRTHVDCSLWPTGAIPLDRGFGKSLWTLPCQNAAPKPPEHTTFVFELHKKPRRKMMMTTTRRPWFWKRWFGRRQMMKSPSEEEADDGWNSNTKWQKDC